MSIAPQSLMEKLRFMPDQELAAFARANHNDPMVFPLVFDESQSRQRLRAAKQAQLAGQKQPTVAQQDLHQIEQTAHPRMPAAAPQMPPQMAQAEELPEDSGIGQLPAPNMQTINKAGGGIVAFAGQDGSQVKDRSQMIQYIMSEAQRLGIDPNLAVRMFNEESRFKTNAVSPKGAGGLGQLMPKTAKGLGLTEEERFDPAKNVTASLTYLKSMMNKYGGDTAKAVAAYNWGPGNLDKHLKKNEGEMNPVGLPKETAKYLTKLLPISEARAEDAELAKVRNAAPTITPDKKTQAVAKVDNSVPTAVKDAVASPAGTGEQPLVSPERRANYGMWESIKNYYQSPYTWADTKRDVNNALNAMGGWSSPLSMAGRGVGAASGELAATPEMVQKAAQAAQVANTPRLGAPAAQGVASLLPEAQAAREAAIAAKQARALEQDVAAAKAAQQSVDAAKLTSQGARAVEEGIAKLPRQAGTLSTQVSTAARANMAGNMIDDALAAQNATQGAADTSGADGSNPDGAPPDVDSPDGKAAASANKKGGLGDLLNDPMLLMGMHLMSSEGPNFLQNVGKAGLGTAAMVAAQKKDEQERLYKEALAKHYGVDPFVQRLEALEDPAKLRMYQRMKELEREPTTKESLFKQFMTSNAGMSIVKPEDIAPAFQKYVQSYEQMFGPLGGLPAGVKVTKG